MVIILMCYILILIVIIFNNNILRKCFIYLTYNYFKLQKVLKYKDIFSYW